MPNTHGVGVTVFRFVLLHHGLLSQALDDFHCMSCFQCDIGATTQEPVTQLPQTPRRALCSRSVMLVGGCLPFTAASPQ